MRDINKLGTVIAKILEVFHWVGAALMSVATICSAVAPAWVKYIVGFDAKDCCGANLEVYGFEVNAPVPFPNWSDLGGKWNFVNQSSSDIDCRNHCNDCE